MADASAGRMQALGQQLRAGRTTLAEWQTTMMAEIKQAHVAAATAAHGGKAQMSQADHGYTGSLVKKQYQLLRDWSADIASGKAPIDGRLPARAGLYGRAATGSYESMRTRDLLNGGAALQERNVLGAAEHCAGCLAETARGWVGLGQLRPLGSRDCRGNDRCRIDRRAAGRAA